MAGRGDHGWWPYLAPYAALLVIGEATARAAPDALLAGLLAKALIPGALLAWFAARGRLPELRGYRPSPGDVLAGLVIAALWVVPYLVFPSLPRGEAFDPEAAGEARRSLVLGLRVVGFAAVTPFVEELFVRSFLLRFGETFERGDFRSEPIGRFAWRGFLASVLWFTFSHAAWEWGVALAAGIAFNAWLYARRHLGACVVAHAAANAAMWAFVVFGPAPLWGLL
jgi:CAAX prenyl protease-like protein